MPVYKYRNMAEMPDAALQYEPGDPRVFDAVRYLWDLSERLLWPVGTCIPRGVRKYRSVEEADADRERWEQERVDRLRAHRTPGE